MAGFACALACARARDQRVLVLTQANAHRVDRLEILHPTAQDELRALGVWPAFCAETFTPCWSIQSLWGLQDVLDTSFAFHPYSHAWIIEHSRFVSLLERTARDVHVSVMPFNQIPAFERSTNSWMATTRELAFECSMLVDATGHRSILARRFGQTRKVLDRLVVLQADFAPQRTGTLLLEAAQDGWWFVAGTDSRSVVTYVSDAEAIAGSHATTIFDEKLRETEWISRHVSERQGLVSGMRAETSRLQRALGSGWVAVGDAAVCRDPLSGAGSLAALRDALAVAALDGGALGAAYELRFEESWSAVRESHKTAYSAPQPWVGGFWNRRRDGHRQQLRNGPHARTTARLTQ